MLSQISSMHRRPLWLQQLSASIKLFAIALYILCGLLLALLGGFWIRHDLPFQRRIIRYWFRGVLLLLQVHVYCWGKPSRRPSLLLSNHISWLDIPVLGAHFPVNFLSKAEVAKWPVVGWLAKVAGTLFIQRGSGDAGQVGSQLAMHLREGRHVLFFPEGTTTDGHKLKRFFHKLFASAIEADVPVQPVLVCYRDETDALHPLVPFVGDDEFLSHATEILKSNHHIVVDVLVLPQEPLNGRDARTLCRDLEVKMAEALRGLHTLQS